MPTRDVSEDPVLKAVFGGDEKDKRIDALEAELADYRAGPVSPQTAVAMKREFAKQITRIGERAEAAEASRDSWKEGAQQEAAQHDETKARVKELEKGRGANICSSCGHVGDFWFDRTVDREHPHGCYRCEACGKSAERVQGELEKAEARIKDLERACSEANDWAGLAEEKMRKAEAERDRLREALADAESLIDYAELSIDEAVADGWVPPSHQEAKPESDA